MSGHETDFEMVGRTRASAPERTTETTALPAHAPELSSRALADGRTGTLDTPSVVHLQSLAGNASVSRLIEDELAPDKVRSVVGQGGGEQMDPATAQSMGARFGEDFSDVRIHKGGSAAESAQAMHAQAYTVGSDVVFDSGKYDPSSPAGQRTLAHELTHVVQQRSGAVSGTQIGGGLAVSHPSDQFEQAASANAERVMSGSAPAAGGAVAAQRHADEEPTAAVAQRADTEELEEETGAGMMAAQRDGVPEEEEELQA